jgi:DNA polymerase III delta subunit
MIITLAGQNSFALGPELRARVGAFVAEHGDLALERIDGEEAGFAKLREAVTSLPFLASKKLVILRAPGKSKQFLEDFEQLFGEIPETNDIIIVEPKLDKRLTYYKYLKKSTDFHDYPELDLNALTKWLVDNSKELNGSISLSDARYLAERVGLNQQLLSNELEKLILYNPKVTRQTIDLLTDATPQSTIFELLEAAFAGNTRKTMKLYDEQRALKVEPQQIVAMLAWQLHVLAVIKAAGDRSADQIAKDAKLNPFVVRKSQGIACKIAANELKALISGLLEIDAASKRTNLDIDEALQNYLLQLAN